MPLWKVALVGGREAADYDEYDAYVVRAATEEEARALSRDLAYIDKRKLRQFLDSTKWSCELVAQDGPTEIIVESFNAG